MDYRIQDAGTHLVVDISGVPTIGEVRMMQQELLEQMRASGLKRVLLQAKVAKGLDLVATKSSVEDVPRLGFPPDVRFALLLLDAQARRSAEFAQDVAENRGIAMRVFSERDAALQWLTA